MSRLVSESEALSTVLTAVEPLAPQQLPLLQSLHHYAAHSHHASLPQPLFDNSAMDGYALSAADLSAGTLIRVLPQQQAAGPTVPGLQVSSGSGIRIFTGAPIPQGTAAVIMQEDVARESHHGADHIRVVESAAPGEHIRRAGQDLCRGQLYLEKGQLITPAIAALLASQGQSQVSVHRAPRVAILSTGDELIPPGQPLAAGQLFESNATMLAALVQQLGIRSVSTQHCRDDLPSLKATLADLLDQHDAVIISGGVSVGEHDYVKPALSQLGVQQQLWRVRIKPGKPFLYGQKERAHVFGLPGNPVSSFVTYQLFVRPALLRLMGAADTQPSLHPAVTQQELSNPGDRPHYLRGRYEQGSFRPVGLQQSHALYALAQANSMLRLESQQTLPAGSPCSVWVW